MEPRQQQFSIWYFVFAFLLILGLQNFLFAPHAENLSYSSFKLLLGAGNLEDVIISERTISGMFRNEGLESLLPREKLEELKKFEPGAHPFITVRVDDPDLVKELEAARVHFTGRIDSNWMGSLLSWIFPAVIFFAIWGLLMKRMGGAAGGMRVDRHQDYLFPAGRSWRRRDEWTATTISRPVRGAE